ncbi:hypothetical protein J2X69_003332 [Algoriphagus sp. 4150]|nr:hypothetical protein [Algoriphagus sp. 4150]
MVLFRICNAGDDGFGSFFLSYEVIPLALSGLSVPSIGFQEKNPSEIFSTATAH